MVLHPEIPLEPYALDRSRPVHDPDLPSWRHLFEQKRTSSQQLSHFFRHMKGRPQWAQPFTGKSDFFTDLPDPLP